MEGDIKGVDPWALFLWPRYESMVHGISCKVDEYAIVKCERLSLVTNTQHWTLSQDN
jgi:hypothetical protein